MAKMIGAHTQQRTKQLRLIFVSFFILLIHRYPPPLLCGTLWHLPLPALQQLRTTKADSWWVSPAPWIGWTVPPPHSKRSQGDPSRHPDNSPPHACISPVSRDARGTSWPSRLGSPVQAGSLDGRCTSGLDHSLLAGFLCQSRPWRQTCPLDRRSRRSVLLGSPVQPCCFDGRCIFRLDTLAGFPNGWGRAADGWVAGRGWVGDEEVRSHTRYVPNQRESPNLA
jgi:hypothetical protein